MSGLAFGASGFDNVRVLVFFLSLYVKSLGVSMAWDLSWDMKT